MRKPGEKGISYSKPLTTQRKRGSAKLTKEDIEFLRKYKLEEFIKEGDLKIWKMH